MIPSPSAEFTTEEARQIGARPFVKFVISPNYFQTGVGAGLGTFTDSHFVSPDRIQVDDDVASASWVSDNLETDVADLPTTVAASYILNLPGFDADVEYRTAFTEAQLALESWVDLVSGTNIGLEQYYQWQVSWTAYRAWAFDTLELAEASDLSAWAIEAVDPEDTYQSYASDSDTGNLETFIEDMQFLGTFRIPDGDIFEAGNLSLSAPLDFSSLISGDHSMRLLNRNNRYNPRHTNFIFQGENDWQRKNISIEFGFRTPLLGFWGSPWGGNWGLASYSESDTILLYEGQILDWGPVPISIDDSSYDVGEVEIYSRDAIALMMERLIGVPDDDGAPNPLVTGKILREATALGDNAPDPPVRFVDYESNTILNEVDTVDLSGANNVIELSAVDFYNGSQCLRSYVESAGYGRVWVNYPVTTDNFMIRTAINFKYIPNQPKALNADFLRVKIGGIDTLFLKINSDHKVYVEVMGMGTKETSWDISANQNIWHDVVIGVFGRNPGILRISVNGDQVLNWDKDDAGDPVNFSPLNSVQSVSFGVNTVLAETWEVLYDDSKLYNTFYPTAFYVPGGPFLDISAVYQDGSLKVKKGEAVKYNPGIAVSEIDLTMYPEKGMVTFDDLANQPSGSIYFMLQKDLNEHPADALESILSAGDKDDLIDTTSFNGVKTDFPNDTIGCYFDNVQMADAILSICQRLLINFVVSQGTVKLISYDGTAPTSYDWQITTSVCSALSLSDKSQNKKNKVSVKWGWYEANSRLYAAFKDEDSITKLGTLEESLDFSWGGDVGSNNSDMAKARANYLLNRLKGSLTQLEDVSLLPWKFVRSEIGDVAEVNIPYFGPAENYRIVGKDLNLSPPYEVKLTLALFPGES